MLAEQWDAAREERVRIARTPAIVVNGAQEYGIRYYGTPDGYELETFLAIIRAVSEGRSELSEASRAIWPFVAALVLVNALLIVFPALTTVVPDLFFD